MRRAARIDANQPAIVRALRDAGCIVADTSSMGAGFPDLTVRTATCATKSGWYEVRMLEIKNPAMPKSDQELTPQQVAFHALWKVVHVVKTVDDALRAMGIGHDPKSEREKAAAELMPTIGARKAALRLGCSRMTIYRRSARHWKR